MKYCLSLNEICKTKTVMLICIKLCKHDLKIFEGKLLISYLYEFYSAKSLSSRIIRQALDITLASTKNRGSCETYALNHLMPHLSHSAENIC